MQGLGCVLVLGVVKPHAARPFAQLHAVWATWPLPDQKAGLSNTGLGKIRIQAELAKGTALTLRCEWFPINHPPSRPLPALLARSSSEMKHGDRVG